MIFLLFLLLSNLFHCHRLVLLYLKHPNKSFFLTLSTFCHFYHTITLLSILLFYFFHLTSKFYFYSGKHHCRQCGNIICSACSTHRIVIPELGFTEPVRVCDVCHNTSNNKKGYSVQDNENQKKNELSSSASTSFFSYTVGVDPSTSLERMKHLRTRHILLSDICSIYSRRHLLRKSALELMTISPKRKGK